MRVIKITRSQEVRKDKQMPQSECTRKKEAPAEPTIFELFYRTALDAQLKTEQEEKRRQLKLRQEKADRLSRDAERQKYERASLMVEGLTGAFETQTTNLIMANISKFDGLNTSEAYLTTLRVLAGFNGSNPGDSFMR